MPTRGSPHNCKRHLRRAVGCQKAIGERPTSPDANRAPAVSQRLTIRPPEPPFCPVIRDFGLAEASAQLYKPLRLNGWKRPQRLNKRPTTSRLSNEGASRLHLILTRALGLSGEIPVSMRGNCGDTIKHTLKQLVAGPAGPRAV